MVCLDKTITQVAFPLFILAVTANDAVANGTVSVCTSGFTTTRAIMRDLSNVDVALTESVNNSVHTFTGTVSFTDSGGTTATLGNNQS